jgi:hypothetical protein
VPARRRADLPARGVAYYVVAIHDVRHEWMIPDREAPPLPDPPLRFLCAFAPLRETPRSFGRVTQRRNGAKADRRCGRRLPSMPACLLLSACVSVANLRQTTRNRSET